MDKILENEGFHFIKRSIFKNMDPEDIESCREVKESWSASLKELHQDSLKKCLEKFEEDICVSGDKVKNFVPGWVRGVKALAKSGGIASLKAALKELEDLEGYDQLRDPVKQIGK